MSSLNKVMLIGNVGAAPEARVLQGGGAVTNLAIATGRTWKDKDSGEQKEKTEWHRVIVYAKQAEFVTNFVGKGAKVYIEGRIETRKWTDKDGIEKYSTEVIADSMQMLGSRQGMGGGSAAMDDASYGSAPAKTAASGARAPAKQAPSMSDMDDDIPF